MNIWQGSGSAMGNNSLYEYSKNEQGSIEIDGDNYSNEVLMGKFIIHGEYRPIETESSTRSTDPDL